MFLKIFLLHTFIIYKYLICLVLNDNNTAMSTGDWAEALYSGRTRSKVIQMKSR